MRVNPKFGFPMTQSITNSMDGLRRFSDAIDPFRMISEVSPRDVASLLPGAGIVEGGELFGSARDRLSEGDYFGAAGDYALGTVNVATDMFPLTAIFAGPAARTANRAMLRRAQDMAESGADRRAIWDETGWFRGPDGQWRFEIDDSGAGCERISTR